MKRLKKGLTWLLCAVTLLMGGCGRAQDKEPFDENKITFLDAVSVQVDSPEVLLWLYRPLRYVRPTSNATVLAPVWFNVKKDENADELVFEVMADNMKSYTQSAHDDGYKIWATVQSFDPEMSEKLVTDQQEKQAFIQKLKEHVEENGFDGVNIDFENMDPANKALFTAFVKDVGEALGEDITLSVCVTVPLEYAEPTNFYQSYDHEELAKVCDYIAVMAYEQNGKFSDTDGPTGGIDWMVRYLQRTLDMVPSEKIIWGIPFYGRDYQYDADTQQPLWKGADAKLPVATYEQMDALIEEGQYLDNEDYLVISDTGQVAPLWDDLAATPHVEFICIDNKLHKIWYENRQSVARKSALVLQYGLAGVGVWEDSYSHHMLWRGVRAGLTTPTLPQEMIAIIQEGMVSAKMTPPEQKRGIQADQKAQERLLKLLQMSQLGEENGKDTQAVLSVELGSGRELVWHVYTFSNRLLLVPYDNYTLLVCGKSLYLPEGLTLEMLTGVFEVEQPQQAEK
ncbi:MAG: glycosyl hydrolase family 18 protein [Christensenellales bacterium]|jgi:spore germination protein YaaH